MIIGFDPGPCELKACGPGITGEIMKRKSAPLCRIVDHEVRYIFNETGQVYRQAWEILACGHRGQVHQGSRSHAKAKRWHCLRCAEEEETCNIER